MLLFVPPYCRCYSDMCDDIRYASLTLWRHVSVSWHPYTEILDVDTSKCGDVVWIDLACDGVERTRGLIKLREFLQQRRAFWLLRYAESCVAGVLLFAPPLCPVSQTAGRPKQSALTYCRAVPPPPIPASQRRKTRFNLKALRMAHCNEHWTVIIGWGFCVAQEFRKPGSFLGLKLERWTRIQVSCAHLIRTIIQAHTLGYLFL
jgi:hypothetical protein